MPEAILGYTRSFLKTKTTTKKELVLRPRYPLICGHCEASMAELSTFIYKARRRGLENYMTCPERRKLQKKCRFMGLEGMAVTMPAGSLLGKVKSDQLKTNT